MHRTHAHGSSARRSRVPPEPDGPCAVRRAGGRHEGCQIGTAWAMRRGTDIWLPYYRDLGVVLERRHDAARGLPRGLRQGRRPSTGGRQMPAHWGSRRLGIITGSSPIATQVPHAAGIAYAAKYRGEDAVVACWFGEGATSEGDWHEGLNFAGVHRLPVVFVCENNQYAISVPQSKQMAVKDVAQPRGGLRVPRGRRRRQRRPRVLRGDEDRPRAGAPRRRADADRVQDLPLRAAHVRRRRQELPLARGGRGGEGPRPAGPVRRVPASSTTCWTTPRTRRSGRRSRRRSTTRSRRVERARPRSRHRLLHVFGEEER